MTSNSPIGSFSVGWSARMHPARQEGGFRQQRGSRPSRGRRDGAWTPLSSGSTSPPDPAQPRRARSPVDSVGTAQQGDSAQTQPPGFAVDNFPFPEAHALKVLFWLSPALADGDPLVDAPSFDPPLLHHGDIAPDLFVAGNEVGADMVGIGKIQVEISPGREEIDQSGQHFQVVVRSFQVSENTKERSDQAEGGWLEWKRTQVSADHRPMLDGAGEEMRRQIDSKRATTGGSQGLQMPTGTTPCVQNGKLGGSDPAQEGCHLDPRLGGISMPIELFVEWSEPALEPLHRRQAVAARPRTATASRASAGEKLEGIQASGPRRRPLMRAGLRRLTTPKGQPLNSASTSK